MTHTTRAADLLEAEAPAQAGVPELAITPTEPLYSARECGREFAAVLERAVTNVVSIPRQSQARPTLTPFLGALMLATGCSPLDPNTVMQAAPLWVALCAGMVPGLTIYGLAWHDKVKAYLADKTPRDLLGFIPHHYYASSSDKLTQYYQLAFSVGPAMGFFAGALWAYSQGQPFWVTERDGGGTGAISNLYGIIPNEFMGGWAGATLALISPALFFGVVKPFAEMASHVKNLGVNAWREFRGEGDTWDPQKYAAPDKVNGLMHTDTVAEILSMSLCLVPELRGRAKDMLSLNSPDKVRDALFVTEAAKIQELIADMLAALKSSQTDAKFKTSVIETLTIFFGHLPEQDPGEIILALLPLLGAHTAEVMCFNQRFLPNCGENSRRAIAQALLERFADVKHSKSRTEGLALCLSLKIFADHAPDEGVILKLCQASLPQLDSASKDVAAAASAAHAHMFRRLSRAGRSRYLAILTGEIERMPVAKTLTKGQKNRFQKIAGVIKSFFADLDITEQQSVLALFVRYDYAFEGHVLDDFVPLIAPKTADTQAFVPQAHRQFLKHVLRTFLETSVRIDMTNFGRLLTDQDSQDLDRALDDLMAYPNSDQWAEALTRLEIHLSEMTDLTKRDKIVDHFVAALGDARSEVRGFAVRVLTMLHQHALKGVARETLKEKIKALASAPDSLETQVAVVGLWHSFETVQPAKPVSEASSESLEDRLRRLQAAAQNRTRS